jgi:hypothetical protein
MLVTMVDQFEEKNCQYIFPNAVFPEIFPDRRENIDPLDK